MLESGWEDQWDRVKRGLRRLEDIYHGREGDSAEARQDMYSFFTNAFHLRDWLAGDPASGVNESTAWGAIKASVALQVCTDLANRTKHYTLTRPGQIDQQTAVTRQDATVQLGGSHPGAAHAWVIEADGQSYDALVLARDVVTAWEAFLRPRGLIP